MALIPEKGSLIWGHGDFGEAARVTLAEEQDVGVWNLGLPKHSVPEGSVLLSTIEETLRWGTIYVTAPTPYLPSDLDILKQARGLRIFTPSMLEQPYRQLKKAGFFEDGEETILAHPEFGLNFEGKQMSLWERLRGLRLVGKKIVVTDYVGQKAVETLDRWHNQGAIVIVDKELAHNDELLEEHDGYMGVNHVLSANLGIALDLLGIPDDERFELPSTRRLIDLRNNARGQSPDLARSINELNWRSPETRVRLLHALFVQHVGYSFDAMVPGIGSDRRIAGLEAMDDKLDEIIALAMASKMAVARAVDEVSDRTMTPKPSEADQVIRDIQLSYWAKRYLPKEVARALRLGRQQLRREFMNRMHDREHPKEVTDQQEFVLQVHEEVTDEQRLAANRGY